MNMKRFLILLLLLALATVLVACGTDTTDPAAATDAPATTVLATDVPATEVPAATEEPMAEPTEAPMEEPTEEPMAEPTEEMAMEPCAPATDGEFAGVDIRGVNVVWWHNHTGSRADLLIPLVQQFNDSNECGITVDAQSQGSYNDIRDKVNGSIAAGELPAALIVGYQNDQAFYQLNDSLENLDTYINDAHWGLTADEVSDFYGSFFDQSIHAVFDNQRLGFPPNRSMEMLFYNKTWLAELGFENGPTTPEEFREMACAGAAERGDGTGGYILRDDASAVASWTYAFGGDVLNEDGTGYNYSSEATVAAMTFLKGLYDDGCAYFYTEGFPNPEVANRRALFAQGSSSGIPFYVGDFKTVADEAGREPDEVGVTAIPHTTPDPVQNVYGGDVMIVKTTPEQDLAAWYFIKWFTSPEVQAEWVEISGYFPTRASTREFLGEYETANAVWATAADLLQYSAYEPQLISYQAVRDAATGAFNEIMQGADIQATLDALTETANELQEELMAEVEG